MAKKQKTHKGTKKRVKLKGKKVQVMHAFTGHKKTSKTSRRKRRLKKSKLLDSSLERTARRLLQK